MLKAAFSLLAKAFSLFSTLICVLVLRTKKRFVTNSTYKLLSKALRPHILKERYIIPF